MLRPFPACEQGPASYFDFAIAHPIFCGIKRVGGVKAVSGFVSSLSVTHYTDRCLLRPDSLFPISDYFHPNGMIPVTLREDGLHRRRDF
jgi:hypothetical protein